MRVEDGAVLDAEVFMFTDEQEFENEVRRMARLLWPAAEYGGAALSEGRERDGIFESDEFVHVIECTVSRTRAKAVEDFNRLDKLTRQIQAKQPHKFVKGWFVTLNEPTADQREVFGKTKNRLVVV
jgi:hypothetical protein